jgi:LuxR family transcriptional regulator
MMIPFIEAAARARSMEELWDIYQGRMSEFGFTRVLYGFTVQRTATSLGDPQDLVVLSNHDRDYMEAFMERGLYFSAPMLRWALANVGAQSWSMIQHMAEANGLSALERKVFDFNRTHGVVAGYTISLPEASRREKGAVSLAAKPGETQGDVDAVWVDHGRTIIALTNVAHMKMLSLPHQNSRRPLTKRQREVLEWVGDGKTTADIATIMGLTSATVEKHLRLAREALDVDTTAQAVLKASFQNQIYVLAQ